MEDFRGLWPGTGCEADGAGDICRDPGAGVKPPIGCEDELCFFFFFRVDSFPLDSERFGEPALLRDFAFFKGSLCLGRPDGVFVPFDEAPDGSLESDFSVFSFALFLASSSFFLSISASFSSSEVSSSL